MTEEQVIKGKQILDEIHICEEKIKNVDRLLDYIFEIKADEIEIQIHEKWVNTPYATVFRTNFISFLRSEKANTKLNIQSLKERLENI